MKKKKVWKQNGITRAIKSELKQIKHRVGGKNNVKN